MWVFKAFKRGGERDFEEEEKKGIFAVLEKGNLTLQFVWSAVFVLIGSFLAHYIAANFFFNNPEEHEGFIWLFVIIIGCIIVAVCVIRVLVRLLRTAIKTMDEDRLIINNVVGGTMISHFDDRFTIKSVTPMFYKMFGYNRGDVKKKYRSEFFCMLVGEESKRQFARQKRLLRENGTADAQYKMLTGKGEEMWVSSHSQLTTTQNGLESVVYTVLFDISNEKKALEKLALAEARNKIVLEKTECCIFEWNIIKDSYEVSDLFAGRFGVGEDFKDNGNLLAKFIHKDDEQRMLNCLYDLREGISDNFEIIVRLKDASNAYTHNTLTLTSVKDNNNVPIRVIGVVVNVEEQYLKEQKLRAQAATDSLTGIYNKGATEKMIRSAIEGHQSQSHALLIIDVDDFKNVNDTLGHASGDEALKLVSKTISEEFELTDIVGRIGGDEFMVFAVNVGGNEKRVTNALDRIKARNMAVSAGGKSISLTLSIGISFYKNDDTTYDGLFKKSDLALYTSKHNGKDRYTLYSKETAE